MKKNQNTPILTRAAYFFMLVSTIGMAAACSNDLGNYDYHDISEIKISGVGSSYSVRIGVDTLRITPTFESEGPSLATGELEYFWILRKSALQYDTIGREANLTYPIRLAPGSYELFLRVIQPSTRINWIANSKIEVVTPFSRGFLIMGEDERGKAEAEMLAMASDTVLIKGILSQSGLPELTGPVSFFHTSGTASYARLWVMTEGGSYYLDPASLEGSPSNTLKRVTFMSENVDESGMHPVVVAPQIRTAAGAIGSTLYRALITKGGDLFASVPLVMGGDYYNNPVNRVQPPPAPRLKAAPYLFYPIGSMSNVMWYDLDNDRFLNLTSIGVATTSVVLNDGANDLFPWNQPTGRTLVYGENTRNTDGGSTNGNSFAIMKDADGTHHIYKFYANGTNPAKRAAYVVKPIAVDFEKADSYAFSSQRSVVFYSVGNHLYAYDYNPGFEKHYSFPQIGSDEITMLKFDTQLDHLTNHLFIATYHESSKGTLRRFQVGTNPDVVEVSLVPNSTWTGLIRVRDINWRAIN